MQLKVGNFEFDIGACGCRPRTETKRDRRGFPYAKRCSLAVEGTLIEDDSQRIKAKLAEMVAALERGTGDVVLYDLQNRKTGINLSAAQAVGNVIVLDKITHDRVDGTQWENYLDFAFEISAEYKATGLAPGELIDFQEKFFRVGNGGPLEVQQEVLTGPSIRVRLVEQTACEAVQAGFAVGFGGYPRFPAPLYPRYLQNKEEAVTYTSGSGYAAQEFRVDWQYRFTSPRPLKGLPNLWR